MRSSKKFTAEKRWPIQYRRCKTGMESPVRKGWGEQLRINSPSASHLVSSLTTLSTLVGAPIKFCFLDKAPLSAQHSGSAMDMIKISFLSFCGKFKRWLFSMTYSCTFNVITYLFIATLPNLSNYLLYKF